MRITAILIICALLSGCGWHRLSKTDKVMLATAWALAATDAYQTSRISEYDHLEEGNPMFSDSTGPVFILGSAALITAIYPWIKPSYRKWIGWSFIGVRGLVVKNNYDLGIR